MAERPTRYDLDALPGGALIRQGLADLEAGRQSIATLLIDIARPRLTELGVVPRSAPPAVAEPERDGRDLVGRAIGTIIDRSLNVVGVPPVLSKCRFGVGIARVEVAGARLERASGIARELGREP